MNHILPDRMNRIQRGHRMNTNEHIITVLQGDPDRWLTSSEIVSRMGVSVTRAVSKRLNLICDECPAIECMIDDATRKRYYRYNTVEETNEE